MERDTVIYNLKNGKYLVHNIKLEEISFFTEVAIGYTKIFNQLKFTEKKHTPVVGRFFSFMMNSKFEIECWEYAL